MILPLAHGIESRADLPIPTAYFVYGAALVLIVSFGALATMWKRPLLQDPEQGRPVAPLGVWADIVLGALGVVLYGLVVYSGLAGTDIAAENLAPTYVYVCSGSGGDRLAAVRRRPAAADPVAGDRPRRGLDRRTRRGRRAPGAAALPRRVGRGRRSRHRRLRLARAGGRQRRAPRKLLAIMAIVYMAVMLIGMSVYGIEPWSRKADPFGVYFGLFARLSWWTRRAGKLILRRPGVGVADLESRPGAVALLCTAIGTTTSTA